MAHTLTPTHDLTTMTPTAIKARLARLDAWPTDARDAITTDPRCGCSADNEGNTCEWDNVDALDAELARRGL